MDSLIYKLKEYLRKNTSELSELLGPNYTVKISAEGIFSVIEEGHIYIDIQILNDKMFNPISFELLFSDFEKNKDLIFELLQKIIFEEDISKSLENECSTNSTFKILKSLIKLVPYPRNSNLINEISTFSEATLLWGLGKATLRNMARSGRLVDGIDYRKSGKQWIIKKSAMVKIYGKL